MGHHAIAKKDGLPVIDQADEWIFFSSCWRDEISPEKIIAK
jgi:hypothetical protein